MRHRGIVAKRHNSLGCRAPPTELLRGVRQPAHQVVGIAQRNNAFETRVRHTPEDHRQPGNQRARGATGRSASE